jgi:hypothetical protein
VNGWDRAEVRARSGEATDIQLKRKDEGTGASKKVWVRVVDKESDNNTGDPCDAFSDVELDVPRGATVQLQTRDSSIEVSDVAVVYAQTQNGDVDIEKSGKIVDASSIGGSISVSESKGRISLHTASGTIDASDVRPADPTDTFEARSLGGEITLNDVAHTQVSATTLNGSLSVNGPLAAAGRYNLRTMSGGITLSMPEDASFQLIARISHAADIITDFPITLTSQTAAKPMPVHAPVSPAKPSAEAKPAPKPPSDPVVVKVEPAVIVKMKAKAKGEPGELPGMSLRRLEGIHGTGDAKLELASFSGTIRLQKQ